MTVAIIEDEIPARKHLTSLITAIQKDVEIAFEAQSVKEAVEFLNEPRQPDLIFMDIQLNDGVSFEIFKKVKVNCPVIFTTAFDQYMLEAFHENGIDYLLKPIKQSDLERAIRKFNDLRSYFSLNIHEVLQRMGKKPSGYKQRFLVKKGISFKSIPVEEVGYFLSEHKVTFLVTTGEKLIYENALADVENQTDPDRFFRINRKFLASRQAIESFRSFEKGKLLVKLLPETKEEVIVSQEKAADFKEWMTG